MLQESFGKDLILFTTDGDSESLLKCGTLPSLFSTVDFGPGEIRSLFILHGYVA